MNTKRWMKILAVGFLLSPTAAMADCEFDLRGEVYCGAGSCVVTGDGVVWCSRHDRGGAWLTLKGEARCGVGQCAANVRGQVYCSSEIGGAAVADGRGQIRCYGKCEPASLEHCERQIADRAGG